jgi:hypothetical protein
MIQCLYRIESHLRGKSNADIFRGRQEKAKPLLKKLFAFLKKIQEEETFTPKDRLLKACNYVLGRKDALSEFLENPRIQLDTNHLERQLRGHALGRKNWMFHMTKEGAEDSAIFYSLLQSCLLVKVNPELYLMDVLQRVTQGVEPELLIPRVWKEQLSEAPLTSPLIPHLIQGSV